MMWKVFCLNIAFLALAGVLAWADDNPCQSVKFHNVEAMESQGAFGLETPELYPDITIRNSFHREIRLSGYPQMFGSVLTPAHHQVHPAWGRDVPSHHYSFPQERMRLWELCQLAQKKNIHDLSIVCKGDSQGPDKLKSECFISTHVGGEDMEKYERHMWGRKIAFSSTTNYFDRGRYTALNNVGVRQDLYGPAIRGAINRIVALESIDPDSKEARLSRDLEYLAQFHGTDDITISPELAECMGKLPFEDFKKWVAWDKAKFPDRPISARKVNEIAESIIFFIIYILPFLL
ncbi:MAG: hypothetical protein A2X86_14670 [Bdellovibrionales bacterium GWA2_49_15]|nr:MAG: hypothetical protein A2X86_14670 [Bdellovibrionales bacterium GWA2_49_15]